MTNNASTPTNPLYTIPCTLCRRNREALIMAKSLRADLAGWDTRRTQVDDLVAHLLRTQHYHYTTDHFETRKGN